VVSSDEVAGPYRQGGQVRDPGTGLRPREPGLVICSTVSGLLG